MRFSDARLNRQIARAAAHEHAREEMRAFRVALGLTQRDLAEALGVSTDFVEKLERGISPWPRGRRDGAAALVHAWIDARRRREDAAFETFHRGGFRP